MTKLEEMVEILMAGGVGLLPSDTIYGLSCLASDENAVERIYKLKGRDYNKPLIILLANAEQAGRLGLNAGELAPASKYWPAPLTVIVRTSKNTPEFLHRGTNTLAVRVPDNKRLQELTSRVGPIVSTSANLQGKPPAVTAKEAKGYFGSKLDFYADAGELKAEPSTIVTLKDGKLNLIRQGAFPVPLNT